MTRQFDGLELLAALSGALAVGAGAFGAHDASGPAAELLKTGGHYQLIHAVAALVAIRFGARGPGWLFVLGGALFALSLYALALGAPRLVGVVTPVGGALLIGGWVWLAWSARGSGRVGWRYRCFTLLPVSPKTAIPKSDGAPYKLPSKGAEHGA